MIHVEPFYDPATYTLTFVVHDTATRDAVVIDPVLDYDPLSSSTSTDSIEKVAQYIREKNLNLRFTLETHAHADHLSASQYLKKHLNAPVAISEKIQVVQEIFKGVFDLPAGFATDGSQFDRLLKDHEVLEAGSLKIKALPTPGHTPACMSFLIEDAVFTGDALFMDDYGTGRCDFPRGDAATLYDSVTQELYALPDETRVFVGHDYQPDGREVAWETTIGKSKASNVQLPAGRSKQEFVKFRENRDAGLAAPRLLFQSVQVNVDAGQLPKPAANQNRYLKVPLNLFKPADEVGSRLEPNKAAQ